MEEQLADARTQGISTAVRPRLPNETFHEIALEITHIMTAEGKTGSSAVRFLLYAEMILTLICIMLNN